MPKMIVYEVFEVSAKDADEAKSKAQDATAHKKSVIVAAPSLAQLAHPAHLADVQLFFGRQEEEDGG